MRSQGSFFSIKAVFEIISKKNFFIFDWLRRENLFCKILEFGFLSFMKFSEIFYGEQKIFGKFFKRSVKFKTMVESIAKKVKVEFVIHFNEGGFEPDLSKCGQVFATGLSQTDWFFKIIFSLKHMH